MIISLYNYNDLKSGKLDFIFHNFWLTEMGFQQEKKVVRELFKAIENSNHPETIENAIKPFVSDDFTFQSELIMVLD